MSRTAHREGLVVARGLGSNLFLGGGSKRDVYFGALDERTMFFPRSRAEAELRKLHISPNEVAFVPAKLDITVG